ncbi:MAG TPA: class I SAM-dependent methyltransferase, partial [Bacteroidia bacterium]|nr:class I SAM-dependent methyltransferase [Bacteroidia bacterium]
RGFSDLTVLDISQAALDRAKNRLGERGEKVKWICADAAEFVPAEKYDFWHDRAAFHFLTDEADISKYIQTLQLNIVPGGALVLATFSESGPTKCSGINIRQYSENAMTARLEKFFEKIRCVSVDHQTPFDTVQNFLFCAFRKK